MYIVVEGIDGSGKTLLSKAIVERFGKRAMYHREPSDGTVGQMIRRMIMSTSEEVDPRMIASLFLADRRLSLPPALMATPETSLLVSDRNFLSTMAYQSRSDGSGFSLDELFEMHDGIPRPNLVLYLECDVRTAMSRVRARGVGAVDHFEKDHFLVETVARYNTVLRRLARERVSICRIDSSRHFSEVLAAALMAVMSHADYPKPKKQAQS